MDAIEYMDIHLDTTGRRFYDYQKSAVVTGPDDPFMPTSEQNNSKYTSSRMSHIVDTHLMTKDLTEKFAPPQASKSASYRTSMYGNTTADAIPRHTFPVYYPGETIHGCLHLKLTKPVEARALSVDLFGRTCVKIKAGKASFFQTETYASATNILWLSQEAAKKEYKAINTDLTPSNEPFLKEGTHTLRFCFRLPMASAPTYIQLVDRYNNYIYIFYRIKAALELGRWFGYGNPVSLRGIWVDYPANVAQMAEYFQPVFGELIQQRGCISGNITLKVQAPRSAFARYEKIPIQIEINNGSKLAIK